jgi:hypothetical protein
MFWLTGMPGWMRAGFWPGNPFGFCRWFPWMPRWWWTGAYGPVQWTPQTTQPSTQQIPVAPMQFQPQMTKEQEIRYLEQELKALEEEKKALEEDLESIKKRINELKSQE